MSTENITPLQEAIEIFRNRKELSSVSPYSLGMADAIVVLESLLPKEKDFVQRVWEAAERFAEDEENNSKFEFINQLYPEK